MMGDNKNEKHNSLLKTERLSIGYGKRHTTVLYSDLDLTVNPGSLTCLMGRNGAGKSTLLRTLTGLQPPLTGRILYQDDPYLVNSARRRSRVFSVVLTERGFAGVLRAHELVALGRHPHTGWMGSYGAEDVEQVKWALRAMRAEGLAERFVHTLSDGERQRILIARALAQETPLVILDEPTAFLDLAHKIELMHILRKLAHECSLALLMSTHDLDLALQHGDSLWLMGQEGCFESGAPEDLLLSGSIESIFGNEQLSFDRARGVFSASRHYSLHARLRGEILPLKWTQNALEKIGVGISEHNAAFDIVIETDPGTNRYCWSCQHGSDKKIFRSTAALLQWIRSLMAKPVF